MYAPSCPYPNITPLKPNKFRFMVTHIPEFETLIQYIKTPAIKTEAYIQSTLHNPVFYAGERLSYDDLVVGFAIDSELLNYKLIQQWLDNNSVSETKEQYKNIEPFKERKYDTGTLLVYGDKEEVVFQANYMKMFPIHLSSFNLSTTPQFPMVMAEVVFKFDYIDITNLNSST